jgi:pimeloyl-ACP methyl ester carboxylesterase
MPGTVVLVHGLGHSARYWRRLAEALAKRGFEVVAPDLRGFGDAPLPLGPYAIEDLAADLDARVEGRFHLVGHSMGGMVALAWALLRPERVRTLGLCSTSSHSGRRAAAFARAMAMLSTDGFDRTIADPVRKAEVERIVEGIAPYVGPVLELLRTLTLRPDPARALAWQAIATFSVKDRLGEIRCPTLVLHGDADPNIPFAAGQAIAAAVPGSTWVPVAGGGHDVPIDHADLFESRLLALFDWGD